MIKLRNCLGPWGMAWGLLLGAFCMAGCKSDSPLPKFAELPGTPAATNRPAPPPVAAVTNPPAATNSVRAAIPVVASGVGSQAGVTNPGGTNSPIVRTADFGSIELIGVGDALSVVFSDITAPPAPFDERVKQDGTITLIHNQTFVAAGKTRGEFEKEIRNRYVPDYYRYLTVTVRLMGRFYFVTGEVKAPNRYIYEGKTTVLKAVASAGDFTDFAKKTGVQLNRANGRTEIEDCTKARKKPSLDLEIFPGDTIFVPRTIW